MVTAGLAATALLVTGCSATPAAPITVAEVVAERAAALESTEREEFDAFLITSSPRFAELGLPLPEFQGVVSAEEWDSAVSACVIALAPQLDAERLDGRITVNYFGVVGEPFERTRWVLEGCIAQYGVADPRTAPPPGPVEVAWHYHDATQRLLPCLRGIGAVVPTPPGATAYAERFGTERAWSPFALVAHDPAALSRALALCPSSAAIIADASGAAP